MTHLAMLLSVCSFSGVCKHDKTHTILLVKPMWLLSPRVCIAYAPCCIQPAIKEQSVQALQHTVHQKFASLCCTSSLLCDLTTTPCTCAHHLRTLSDQCLIAGLQSVSADEGQNQADAGIPHQKLVPSDPAGAGIHT